MSPEEVNQCGLEVKIPIIFVILPILIFVLFRIIIALREQLVAYLSLSSTWIMLAKMAGGQVFGALGQQISLAYKIIIAFINHRSKLACDGSRFKNMAWFMFCMAIQLFVINVGMGFVLSQGLSFARLFLVPEFYMCTSVKCLGEFAGQTSSNYFYKAISSFLYYIY